MMLCLKKKKFWGSSSSYGPQSQSKSYGLEQGSGTSSEEPAANKRVTREASRAKDMAPPPAAAPAVHPVVREVTEDTPADLLEGTMDLMVILPSGKTVQSTVDRKTPMMDLLIHTATANKINPAGHIVQVRNERGIEMPYKPSTPIGALDTTTIEIVPKNRVNEYIIVKKPAKVANQPFETTFRLQVHLPRNQLHVMRVSSKILLDEILREVCHEKNLDISKYEIRHPANLDHKLPVSLTVGETGLQELTVVSKNSKINSSVSSADIIALQQSEEGRGKGCLDGSFKHSRSSVGDSSVSSESTGSGRGISPCRSEDSRSISPLPLIRPKTLIHSRTASNLSTCSSSGNSSSGHLKTNTLNSSTLSSQVSHQQVIMQAPPRTKKRAAPQPPTTPAGAKVNNSNNSLNCSSTSLNISSPNATCTTPTNGISIKVGTPGAGGSLEKPTPRKKEAPREPPKPHHPLTHHQSLPLNHHSRHNSGSNATDSQQDIGPLVRQDSQPQMERTHHPGIAKMSSSMTNLTSVSSVSSTSLASSTGGGSKKRRAPKPPALAALKTPAQIEEETTDSEASTLRGGDGALGSSSANESNNSSPQRNPIHSDLSKTNGTTTNAKIGADQESLPTAAAVQGNGMVVPDDPKEIEVLSPSPVSSLSSPSNSASESNSSSPIPPSSSVSQVTMKEQAQPRSLNTNEAGLRSGRSSSAATGSQHEDQEYESESRSSIRSYSRSSSSPSSSSNSTGAPSPPHADSTSVVVERSSRNELSSSSNAATTSVGPDAQSSPRRPPSNTQVSPPPRSSSSQSARAMPMPLPRRRAPPAPSENTSAFSGDNSNANNNAPLQTNKISYERRNPSPLHQENKQKLLEKRATAPPEVYQQQKDPMPKPKPRPDRKSVESIISQTTNVIKPQTNYIRASSTSPSRLVEMKSSQSSDSNPDSSMENDTNTGSAAVQQNQPVLSGQLRNPLAKYGVKVLPDNVLKERAERLKKTDSSTDPTFPSSSAQTNSNASSSLDVDNAQPTQVPHHHKMPIQKRASQSSSSNNTTDDFSDTGSVTSFTKTHKISTGSIGRSGLASKPLPSLAKSDYTSQGSVRSIKQLTSAVASMSAVESANYNDDDSMMGGEYDSDNLEENLDFFEPVGEDRIIGKGSSLTKSVSSSPRTTTSSGPASKQAPAGRQHEKEKVIKTTASGNKPRVFSSVSTYDGNDDDDETSNFIKSPGVVSESGFGRDSSNRKRLIKRKSIEEDSNAKLNRWQNMVSLNEIDTENRNNKRGGAVIGSSGGGDMMSSNNKNNHSNSISHSAVAATTTNKPVGTTRSVSGASSSYKKHATPLLQVDESHNDSTTCHSSESEASYTDSGVPASETVTPSPVNLDDVILDHEYHSGSHSEEKFRPEDGEEVKHSSRRSSIQSDHSEEWMNILEAKMNKDEEAIEKMFEAVLPPAEEINAYTPSPTPPTLEEARNDVQRHDTDDNDAKQGSKQTEVVSRNETHKRREIQTDSEDDYYEGNNKGIENDDFKEMIETTVELHHVPAEQVQDDEESFIETADLSKTLVATSVENAVMSGGASTASSTSSTRKLSKSESFSHNSEFNEAKQRRKNFKSSRSNAMMKRSSQSSGSANDLRRSLSLSDSEEEMEALGPVVERKNRTTTNGAPKHPNDRAVSMSDLYREKMGKISMEKALNEGRATGSTVQKATSLQKLSEDAAGNEEAGQMEDYRKKLEMQFEQWKEEFMKHHGDKTNEENSEIVVEEVERTPNPQVIKSEVENVKETDNLVDKTHEPDSTEVQSFHKVDVLVKTEEETPQENIAQESRAHPSEETLEETEKESEACTEKDVLTLTTKEDEEEMKNMDKFPPVELRKKRETPKVVYQYAGPPTIKMASWGERPHRTVSVKQDRDYIMGMGQQDPNAKAASPGRIHSFHGGPLVSMQSQQQPEVSNTSVSPMKSKRESSPNPTPHIQVNKGWSAAINAPNVLPNSTGAVKSVLSAWKQRMEETEKEKNKPKEGPPAEIDIYGTESTTRSNNNDISTKTATPSTTSPSPLQNGVSSSSKKIDIVERTTPVPENPTPTPKATIGSSQTVKPVVIDSNPIVKVTPPKTLEKSKTLGSSFRTPEKPVVFTISSMESNTLPRQKSTIAVNNGVNKSTTDAVDSTKHSPASSIVEISSSAGSLEDRKKFFQGVKPVENGKEAPIPATNLKSNIAAIQKVFEKQRMTKMQQMGSQQSLYSDGTVSPVPSLQRNDSLESRQSTLRRQNSVESHSSDSSVVLRVSQNSSGKASPQLSSTEMVQKLFGRPHTINNFDPLRRTPSPISSTTSTLSSSTSYERFTPSPTVVDGPNNSVRITTGGYKPHASNPSNNIRSVGNKAIIIVNGEANAKTNAATTRDNRPARTSAVNDNIILSESSGTKKSPVSNAYVSSIIQQQQEQQQQQQKQRNKRDSTPQVSAPVSQIKQNISSSNSFLKKAQSVTEPMIVSQKNVRNAQPNGTAVPPPPPPPPAEGLTPKAQLSLDIKKVSNGGGNARNSKGSTPTSPMSPDPRAEIMNAIKNSNGNFGLRKTGSSILLK